jgi:sulfur-carrier protein
VTIVFVPTMLQSLTSGVKEVEVSAGNVRQVVERLDELYPGIKERLVEEGRLRPNLAVSIDGEIARLGLLEKVAEDSEVHFVPAIGGGASNPGGPASGKID